MLNTDRTMNLDVAIMLDVLHSCEHLGNLHGSSVARTWICPLTRGPTD